MTLEFVQASTSVERMKVTVIMMKNARKVTSVELTIVGLHLISFLLRLTAAIA